jgi:selenocysteine-specific elongation factor
MNDRARHVIMGTAGHVDHGKTALVRALTGIDTDRLKEEQERGISIELGFAHLDLPSGMRVGVVDVPGHEKFVKHMLAGAGGIDFVLLVVAADEGVMPQTIEHGQIVELLGVKHGLVVLTKTDLVEPDLLELAEEDVREYLAGSVFQDWPIQRFSAVTGAGKTELIAAIDTLAQAAPTRSGEGAVRLPVDRVFVMEGFGTVVTGTLWQGTVAEGQQLHLLPGPRPVRVRQVQVHGRKVASAAAGQRVAVALHGVAKEDVARGDWLVTPNAFHETSIIDLRLRAVERGARVIKQRERVHFHLGASETLGRVTLFGREALDPGDDDVAQIRLESPVVAARGDRFVIRWYSPVYTAGGGQVIEPVARKRRRSDVESAATLAVLERGSAADRIAAALAGFLPQGLTPEEIAIRIGSTADEVAAGLAELEEGDHVRAVAPRRYLSQAQVDMMSAEIETAAREYRARYPLRFGIPKGELRSRFARRLAPETVDQVLQLLIANGGYHVREDRLRIGEPTITLPPALRAAVERVRSVLVGAGYSVPTIRDTLAQAGVSAGDAPEFLGYLLSEGKVVRLTEDLIYAPEQMEKLVSEVTAVLKAKGELSVADFKVITGVSRKYAVPLLEYLDNRGVSRRQGDNRVPGRALQSAP